MNGKKKWRFVIRKARHINGRHIQDMKLIHDGRASKINDRCYEAKSEY